MPAAYDCVCDYDAPQFYAAAIRKARKPHRCDECGGCILPGEPYEYVSAKWEDLISVFKTCQHCVDIRTWTKNNVPCLCWAHGNLIEDCREAVTEAAFRAPLETVGLRFGLLRRIALRDRHNRGRRE
jgi:hypothetical protein